ncbi:MAG: zinc ribbon domain-containing protein [Brachybacterium sp.]|nr:zinc ribbon domain-containing protein [Brachybacterium sp.]
MPIYEFRCPDGHVDEVHLPMTDETRRRHCPRCGEVAVRLIGAPGVRRSDPARERLVESTAASAERPTVVDAVPGRGRHARQARVSRDPRHAKLPRP